MTPRPNAARIGLFAIGALTVLVFAVALVFGGKVFMRSERAVMHFSGSVYGLQVGSPVVFRGVRLIHFKIGIYFCTSRKRFYSIIQYTLF